MSQANSARIVAISQRPPQGRRKARQFPTASDVLFFFLQLVSGFSPMGLVIGGTLCWSSRRGSLRTEILVPFQESLRCGTETFPAARIPWVWPW